jgi:hypothetical protein
MDFFSYFVGESNDSKKTSTKKTSSKKTSTGKGDKEKQCGG